MRELIDLIESTHLEFIFEAPADDIITSLEATPFNDTIRKTGNTVYVLVPIAQRQEAISQLMSILPGAKYDAGMTGSSLGGINYQGGKIIIKPTGKQGQGSAGVANEMELFNLLTKLFDQYQTITVEFRAPDGKTFKVENAIGVEHAGKETKGRLKGDIRIVTSDKKHPISIKKVNAEMWESADTYYGATAAQLIKQLHAEGKVELTGLGKFDSTGNEFVRITPEVVVEPTAEEIENVVFGEDIKSLDGAVIVQTFAPQHFTQQEDLLSIDCEAIIRSASDIPKSHLMYWLIRNDSTRPSKYGYPGLRIIAAVQTRAFGKRGDKSVLYVSSDGKELESPLASQAKKQAEIKASQARQAEIGQKIADLDKPTTGLRPPGAKELRAKRGIDDTPRQQR
jgi:hypothetical protein